MIRRNLTTRRKAMRPAKRANGKGLDYAGINDRLYMVFDHMIQELERRNLTFPELLEDYDHKARENELLRKDKDFFFHEMKEWKAMYVEISSWRDCAHEALTVFSNIEQGRFFKRLHELDAEKKALADKRLKEILGDS